MTIADTIPDKSETGNVIDNIDEKNTRAKLGIFLKKLSDKEAQAIKLRFSVKPDGSERTLEEIGKELGMTKMGAKLLIDRTITKLKQFAKQEQLK